ncbi:unnamed protein product [Rotaria sp. Silwood2]|nr:unnamed protein product [Rotaria sp. Silwood2]CAF3001933.1 unnamed protein product [Rotaria sp. Silwood2]CAF3072254.1 unnamed protein product [Rotaria sp. Silwood2]CAF3490610.1 unnamed protein product [Rotaria sp. Silwood2]CAF4406275.1 unnamed protein product [Rotaria sp. Silwood2]
MDFGPICASACIQLPHMIRGEGTATEIACVSGAMTTYSIKSDSQLVTTVDFGIYLAQILDKYPSIQHRIAFYLPHFVNKFQK